MPGHAKKLILCSDMVARGDRHVLLNLGENSPSVVVGDGSGTSLLWRYLKSLTEASPGLMANLWHPDTTVIHASEKFEAQMNVPAGYFYGKKWLGLLADKEAQTELLSGVSRLIQERCAKAAFRRFRTFKGSYIELECIDFPVQDGPESTPVVCSLMFDRSGQEEAVKASFTAIETLDLILDATPRHQIIISQSGRILHESTASKSLREEVGIAAFASIFEMIEPPKGADIRTLLANDCNSRIQYKGRLRLPNGAGKGLKGRFSCSFTRFRWMGSAAWLMDYESGFNSNDSKSPAEELLRQRVASEGALIVSPLQNRAVCLSSGANSSLQAMLALVGRRFNGVRSYIFQSDSSGDYLSNTHEWCSDGISPQLEGLQNTPFIETPWWRNLMRKGRPVIIPSVANLPEEAVHERRILSAQDIVALVAVPLVRDNELIGFVGLDFFEEFTEPPLGLLDDLMMISEAAGRLIADEAVADRRNRWLLQFEELFDGIGIACFDWDVASGQVCFNPSTGRVVGLDVSSPSVMADGLEWWVGRIHPDDRSRASAKVSSFLGNRARNQLLGYRFKVADSGYHRFLEYDSVTRRSDDGEIVAVRGFIFDLDLLAGRFAEALGDGDRFAGLTSLNLPRLHDLLGQLQPFARELDYALGELTAMRSVDSTPALPANSLIAIERLLEAIGLISLIENPEELTLERFSYDRLVSYVRARATEFAGSYTVEPLSDRSIILHSDFMKIGFILSTVLGRIASVSKNSSLTVGIKCAKKRNKGSKLVIDINGEAYLDMAVVVDVMNRNHEGGQWDNALVLAGERLKALGGCCVYSEGAGGGCQGFSLEIPVVIDSSDASDGAIKQVDDGIRVLIVDDDELGAHLTIRGLESSDLPFSCAWARNGREALWWCSENRPAFIVLDLSMPVMNGLDFLDRYSGPGYRGNRAEYGVIVASAYLDQGSLRSIAKYDVLRSIPKPYSVGMLADYLGQIIAGQQLSPQLALVEGGQVE